MKEKIRDVAEHLENSVEDHHKKAAENIENALHKEEYFHSHHSGKKVEIPKHADSEEKISVEYKSDPIPEDTESSFDKVKIEVGNKAKYRAEEAVEEST